MLRRVYIVRTDISEESIATIIRLTRIQGTKLLLALIFIILMMESIDSSETSVLIRATRRHIPEDGIFHSQRREDLRSYIVLSNWAL
jgi:hypothetical protein